MNTLTNEKQKSYQIEKICYICKEKVKENMLKITIIVNIGTIVIIQGNIDVPYVTCLEENTEKYITFSVPIKKKLQELIKKEKKLQNSNADYDLLIAQHLWQAHYQVL